MPWWKFCTRCGNDLNYNTIISEEVAKKRWKELKKWKEKTEKKLGLHKK